MKFYVRGPEKLEYYRQVYKHPTIQVKSEIKPGDTIYCLNAKYYVDRVEYSKSDLLVYATKTPIFT